MTISIRKAYSNIKSIAYDKQNLLVYFYLMLGVAFLNALADYKGIGLGFTAVAYGLYGLITIYTSGMYNIASNNIFKQNQSVFPHVVNDAEKIAETSVKSFGGSLLLWIAFGVIIGIIGGLSCVVNPIFGICVFVILMFLAIVLSTALYACFLSNLQFEQWFNFKKAFYIIKNHFGSICRLYLKQILIFLIFLGMMIPVIILFVVCIFIIAIKNPSQSENIATLSSMLGGFLGVLFGAVLSLFVLDLAGQFVSEVISLEEVQKEEKLKEEEIAQEEYIEENITDEDINE